MKCYRNYVLQIIPIDTLQLVLEFQYLKQNNSQYNPLKYNNKTNILCNKKLETFKTQILKYLLFNVVLAKLAKLSCYLKGNKMFYIIEYLYFTYTKLLLFAKRYCEKLQFLTEMTIHP